MMTVTQPNRIFAIHPGDQMNNMAAYYYVAAMQAQAGYPSTSEPVQANNEELVAGLCKIIERQSKEIRSLRIPHPVVTATKEIQGTSPNTTYATDSDIDEPHDKKATAPQEKTSELVVKPVLTVGCKVVVSEDTSKFSDTEEDAPVRTRPTSPLEPMSGLQTLTVAANEAEVLEGVSKKMKHSLDPDDSLASAKRLKCINSSQAETPGRETAQPAQPVRVCMACGTSSTPKWRCGMTLCNACGLRNAKKAQQASRAAISRAMVPIYPAQGISPADGAMDRCQASFFWPHSSAPPSSINMVNPRPTSVGGYGLLRPIATNPAQSYGMVDSYCMPGSYGTCMGSPSFPYFNQQMPSPGHFPMYSHNVSGAAYYQPNRYQIPAVGGRL